MKTRMKHLPSIFITTLLALLFGVSAYAIPITPTSYDMENGGRGTYRYFDDTYTGAGSNTTSYAQLSGGHGDLTDGIIATQNYTATEVSGHGPYVGWKDNPTITFHFGSVINLNSLTLFLDDIHSAYAYLPASVTLSMGGVTSNYSVSDPNTGTLLPVTLNDLGFIGDTLTMTLNRQNEQWQFLSEATFDGTPVVPEPGTILLLVSGLVGLAGYNMRKYI